jgi:amidase
MPDSSDPLFRNAGDAAALIRTRQLSSRELVEQTLAQIEALNPLLNAVVELRREQALKEDTLADDAVAAGRRLGALHGLPILVKESLNVAGLHTTWGNPAFKNFIAPADATLVRRVRDAGAIILGKANVAFMLADNQTANPVYGASNNPWDLTLTPGGSTGGGAAALASGLTFVTYGSDLSGSIRNPASFCGVYGLRPSVDLVPQTGHEPPGPPQVPIGMMYLPVLGPLARSAEDLRIALRVVAGPEGQLAKSYTWRLPAPRHTRLRDYRVGFVLDHPIAPVASEIKSALTSVVDAIARAGATVKEGWPDGVDPAAQFENFGFHLHSFFAKQLKDSDFDALAKQAKEGAGKPEALMALAWTAPHKIFVDYDNRRILDRAAWTRYFEQYDVFLCPVNCTTAFAHDMRPFEKRTITTPAGDRPYALQFFWTSHAALTGIPAASVPIGRTSAGVPIGGQIIGPMCEDDTPITFAALLADVIGGYERPPITRAEPASRA